ncbi:hypothetical protein CAP36_00220 [Chitinophagaceae bacterium IBVUCB2]|nr:hypothetical protein CAP36_00220 [Chitinophagaceae bacterium IBVUCB2]
MNLRETILAEHSKANCVKIVNWVGHNQQRFNQLFELFLNDEPLIVQRAGWPLSYAVEAHPSFIEKHFSRLLKNLHKPKLHNAVKRNTLRLLQVVSIPEEFHGEVMNTCFNYIISPDEKPAIKAFSLAVLQQLAKQYPDILPEIKSIIEDKWDNESAAFRSRARKILKEKAS